MGGEEEKDKEKKIYGTGQLSSCGGCGKAVGREPSPRPHRTLGTETT